MLEQCSRNLTRVYVIVDGLDECQDEFKDQVASFLRLIVYAGLDRSHEIRWLLTSQPLETRAEKELLTGVDQGLLSLELNFDHIFNALRSYITSEVPELDSRRSHGKTLRESVESELTIKAEAHTYL